MKKINDIEVQYEGMGTCIHAEFIINKERLFTIYANHVSGNKIVQKAVKYLRNELKNTRVPKRKDIDD